MEAGEAHAGLLDEGAEEIVEVVHEVGVAPDFVGAVLLDGADTVILDVAGDDPGEHAPQVGGKFVGRLPAVQLQLGHGVVCDRERQLEIFLDVKPPVEEKGVPRVAPVMTHLLDPGTELAGYHRGIADNDAITTLGPLAEGVADKGVEAMPRW